MVSAHGNDQIEAVQLIWSGKKDQLTLQITLHDNQPLPSLFGRFTTLAKLVVACLNIGSIGYFWFERPGFEQKMFKEVHDLELRRPIDIRRGESFWGAGRAVALTDQHIDHAIHCMMAFAPLPEADAAPIFEPYFHGLALIAKSDVFYNFDILARHAFVNSLAGALRRYCGWSGKLEDFETSLHEGFAPFMPNREDRDQMFRALKTEGNPAETPLVNLRSAKQLADLYLIHTGRRTWRTVLDRTAGTLRVTNKETGRSDTYKTGDFIRESVGQWHTAANIGDESVKLLVIDIVEKGKRTQCSANDRLESVAGAADNLPIRSRKTIRYCNCNHFALI